MRLLLALAFVVAATYTTTLVLDDWISSWGSSVSEIRGIVIILSVVLDAVVAWLLFRPRPTPALDPAQLEAAGLLVRERYRARRAFSIAEFEDEGSHYIIELDDGRVLYLNGQFLYDYEPDDFPCNEFTIVQRTDLDEVIDLIPAGDPFRPEAVLPSFSERAHRSAMVPEPNTVIVGISYEQMRERCERACV